MNMNNNILKIGILGGTFNPIHNGHLAIASCALKECSLDKVLVMPSGVSYLKIGSNVLPAAIRREITDLALADYPGLYLDDREIRREGNSYTCDTIRELDSEYPASAEFYFIIGADTLKSIASWKTPDIIFKRCILLTALRDGETAESLSQFSNMLKQRFNADIRYLHIPYYDISSTMLRQMAANGEDFSSFVPYSVYKYIIEKGLYKNENK